MYFDSEVALYSTISRNIKNYRQKSGLTQAQLAEKAGISISYLSKIEAAGCDKGLSIAVLNNIANVLDIEITNFFKEE
ncbi:helix-turn-helix domain-containing protein [Hornefia butyriciproducens]|uniref:helix-turn-helix domain-containing protein n=1 Tax=Hornefia butyriciproducens TaxID=2652293 RepID=UPI003F89CC16